MGPIPSDIGTCHIVGGRERIKGSVHIPLDTALCWVVGLLVVITSIDAFRLGVPLSLSPIINTGLKAAATLLGVTVVALHATLTPKESRVGLNGAAYLLFSYSAVATFSIFWTPSVRDTLFGVIGLWSILLVGLRSRYLRPEALFGAVRIGCDFVVIGSVLSLLLQMPTANVFLQGMDRLAGISYGPHAVARCAAFATLIRLHSLQRSHHLFKKGVGNLTWLALYAFVIVLADSRQIYLSLPVALAILFLPNRPGRILVRISLGLTVACILAMLLALAGLDPVERILDSLTRNSNEDITNLTGRTAIWHATVNLIVERPILGYGFNAGGLVLSDYYLRFSDWTTQSAHNAVLHCALDLGLVGLTLLGAAVVFILGNTVRSKDRLLLAFVTIVLVIGMIERSIAGAAGLLFLLLATCARPTRAITPVSSTFKTFTCSDK